MSGARIVQVVNYYGPTSGGLLSAVDQLRCGYVEAGHRPALIVPGAADTHRDTPLGPRVSVRSPLLPGGSGARVLGRARALRAAVAALRPDRIEVGDRMVLGWLAPWAAQHDIPLVLIAHDRLAAALAGTRTGGLPGWLPVGATAAALDRRAGARADRVVVTSAYALRAWRDVAVGPVHRVPPGVDLAAFAPRPARPIRDRPQLVHLGRLSRGRSPEVSVDALRLLHDAGVPAALLVIGAGPAAPELTRRAAGLPVRFLGHLGDPAAVAHVVGHADVALVPGTRDFGLAVLAAMACGTPVVVPGDGAAAELVQETSGVGAPVTAPAYAAAVCDLLDRDQGFTRAAARSRAEDYPWSATVAGMLAVHGLEADTRLVTARSA